MFDKKVIHRDIKPENIFVTKKEKNIENSIKSFVFKLGDMGLAKTLDSPTSLT